MGRRLPSKATQRRNPRAGANEILKRVDQLLQMWSRQDGIFGEICRLGFFPVVLEWTLTMSQSMSSPMDPISLIMEFDGLSVDFSSRKFWADFGAGIQYQKCDFQWELCRKEKKRARYTHWYQDRVDSTVRSVPKNRSIHYLMAIIQNRYYKTISVHSDIKHELWSKFWWTT